VCFLKSIIRTLHWSSSVELLKAIHSALLVNELQDPGDFKNSNRRIDVLVMANDGDVIGKSDIYDILDK